MRGVNEPDSHERQDAGAAIAGVSTAYALPQLPCLPLANAVVQPAHAPRHDTIQPIPAWTRDRDRFSASQTMQKSHTFVNISRRLTAPRGKVFADNS